MKAAAVLPCGTFYYDLIVKGCSVTVNDPPVDEILTCVHSNKSY